MLIQNTHGFIDGEEKFSLFISNKAAAAIKPTMAGLSPEKIFSTTTVCIYFINILLIRIIRMSDGNISATVEMALPAIPMVVPYPAFLMAV